MLHAEAQALSVGQGVASLGSGGLAGRGGGAVAHGSPSGRYQFTARLVLIQRTLTSINDPVGWDQNDILLLSLSVVILLQATDALIAIISPPDNCGLRAAEWKPTSDASCQMKLHCSLWWLLWLTARSQQLVRAPAWGFSLFPRWISRLCVVCVPLEDQTTLLVYGSAALGQSHAGELNLSVCVRLYRLHFQSLAALLHFLYGHFGWSKSFSLSSTISLYMVKKCIGLMLLHSVLTAWRCPVLWMMVDFIWLSRKR